MAACLLASAEVSLFDSFALSETALPADLMREPTGASLSLAVCLLASLEAPWPAPIRQFISFAVKVWRHVQQITHPEPCRRRSWRCP